MFNIPFRPVHEMRDINENFNYLADDVEWNDINLGSSGLGRGASAPDLVAFLAAGNLLLPGFDGNVTTEQLYGSFELLHNWKQGTDIEFHVHWTPTTANAGNVKWQLEYSWQNIDGTFPAVTTISVIDAAGGTAWTHNKAAFTRISATGKKIGTAFVFRFFRNPADGDDTYPDDAGLIQIGVHYQIDSIGSKEIYNK